jgi:hypothetical protein
MAWASLSLTTSASNAGMRSLGDRNWVRNPSRGSEVLASSGPTPPRPLTPWHPRHPLVMKSLSPLGSEVSWAERSAEGQSGRTRVGPRRIRTAPARSEDRRRIDSPRGCGADRGVIGAPFLREPRHVRTHASFGSNPGRRVTTRVLQRCDEGHTPEEASAGGWGGQEPGRPDRARRSMRCRLSGNPSSAELPTVYLSTFPRCRLCRERP